MNIREFAIKWNRRNAYHPTSWNISQKNEIIEDLETLQEDWILRKNEKDRSLYDQSEETIKLVWEVLR